MSEIKDIVEKVMSQIGRTNVEAVFGESRQIGDKVIIPVGKISYGWGGGSGKGPGQEGEGGGFGMGVKVKPIGYITVTADRVTYEPIVDLAPIILAGSLVIGLTLLKLVKFKGKMGHKYHHK